MSSVAQALQTPFDRLNLLPTTMNWRGAWSATQQYFTNDVVVSPLNLATYILSGVSALSGPPDPSLSGNWIELSGTATGVNELQQGVGILLTNGQTNPVVNNAGVLTIGVGVGLSSQGSANEPYLVNEGVISLSVSGAGLSINNSDPHNPIVTNTGVILVNSGGDGIGVDNTNSQLPLISNTGVITITPGDNILVTGDAQNPTISVVASSVSTVGTAALMNLLPTPAPAGPAGVANLTLGGPTSTLFADYLANGAPNATGVFLISLSGLNIFFTLGTGSPVSPNNVIQVSFSDLTLNKNYAVGGGVNDIVLATSADYPINVVSPQLYFNIADARTAGLRELTTITFTNSTTSEFIITSVANVYATYYPAGLQ